jgi:hypothetical protein
MPAYDHEARRRLWTLSEELARLIVRVRLAELVEAKRRTLASAARSDT